MATTTGHLIFISNYGGDRGKPWVSPLDIAAVIAEEIEQPFETRRMRYVASDEASPNEVAQAPGQAIGEPDLPWTGFEHPQTFSKFFKLKTQVFPLAFRRSFTGN